jgi:peptidoglycan/LPS O-acetylase OafA/YrhL
VLSGFILQHSYRHRLGVEGGITPVQFVALRFFRLWPCHIAVILLLILANGSWILSYFLNTFSTRQIFSVIFLLQAWHPDIKVVFALNSPAWSISVEMFFYAMFPLLSRQALKSPLSPMYVGTAITIAWLTPIWLYTQST